MATIVRPLGDKIIVKPERKETMKTQSGIFLPENSSAAEKPQIGIVVSVGEGRLLENGEHSPLAVEVGDKILYRKFAGTEIALDKKEDTILLMTERDVLGIIEEDVA